MDKKSDFVSEITFFPPLTPEENESSVSNLFSKLFKFTSKTKDGEETKETERVDNLSTTTNADPKEKDDNSVVTDQSEAKQEEDLPEGKTFHNVLRRISNLVPLKTSNVTKYADTEQARYWMPDSVSRECYECGARFSAFRRRHHCRVCGQIFCSRCCSHRVPGHVYGCDGGLRVCTYCCKLVLGYLQNADSGVNLTADLKALQENLREKTTVEDVKVEETGFLLNGGADSSRQINDNDSLDSTHDIYERLCSSLPLQQHRFRLLRYPGVWRGGDIIEWLLENRVYITRIQAIEFCQTLIKDELLECVTEQQHFVEYALYKPIISQLSAIPERTLDQNSLSSTSSYCLDLDIVDKSALLQKKYKKDEINVTDNTQKETCVIDNFDDSVFSELKPSCNMIDAAGEEHLRLLLVQGLTRANLSHAWSSILLPLCKQAAYMILPDVTTSEWDIRRCVRVKRVPGGNINESFTMGGVVFSKNVAHRSMLGRKMNPRILLLHCSIVYHRVDGKIVSLEPVIMQEKEYLKNCCARIIALRPDVILVQGNVSRLAQDELKEQGVTLVLNVRPSVLQRVARFSGADIVTSVDARIEHPKLGICKAFYLQNYNSKTLMVLEGFGSDLKACSIILRGAPLEELGLVKNVISFILLSVYNWRLEKSFLEDMRATLPVSNSSLAFTNESKDSSPNDGNKLTKSSIENIYKTDEINPSKDAFKSRIPSDSNSRKQINSLKENEAQFSDPLMNNQHNKNSPVHKKIDSDKGPQLTCGIAVNDFSDPLRSRQLSGDDEVFTSNSFLSTKSIIQNGTLRERWNVEESLLSMSPQIRMCTPFLESEVGKKSHLSHYFCNPLFSHPIKAPGTPRPTNKTRKVDNPLSKIPNSNLKEAHGFVQHALTKNVENCDVQKSLASFRATGAQLPFNNIVKKDPIKMLESNLTIVNKNEKILDPLDPEQHQRLYVLFYVFSSRSTNVPEFCIDPWIVRMDMYGTNDIPLSRFLEKHCFLPNHPCNSSSCRIPLNQHERRFVHGNGCITVTCSVVDTSATRGNSQHIIDEKGKQNVMWWCRCFSCSGAPGGSEAICMKPPSLALSLAKYLEMRFHAPRYSRINSCQHSLNQHHAHYFTCGNITACFKYTEIESWDICLPSSLIITNYNTRTMRENLIDQVNDLVLKGHEIYVGCGDGELEKEQACFKQNMDQIQLNLTSTCLQDQNNNAGVVQWLWSISDALVIGEKLLQESVDKLTVLNNAKSKIKPNQETGPENDKTIDSDDSAQPDTSTIDGTTDYKTSVQSSTEIDHGGEEEEDKIDKKGLRTILSQLLSNSHRGNQNGVVLCNGVIPIIVLAGEVSSVAAAALASFQYHQQFQILLQTKITLSENEEKENQQTNIKDKSETDSKNKNSKNNDHIDITLQDGLLCRVFYAVEFFKLRSILLCPISTNPNITNDFNVTSDASKNSEEQSSENNKYLSTASKEKQSSTFDENLKKSSDEKNKKNKEHAKSSNTQECVSEVEECFIRSLSRCSPWAARGGKSGSTFFKTKDDRFVLKEMSKLELQLFLDLAPHYFQYIQSCHRNKYPSLLGRIVGVFRVDSTAGIGGGVLVMENLWHGRDKITQRFDLKGVQRNRMAEQDSDDVVLLDENFLNLRWKTPIYLQSHSARVLWAAVERDTDFLASHHVMDYSLLVGLDDSKQELVLGIIDYIRTFTWDKKLEHIVKKGLGSGLPTIVSPEQYKVRFYNAIKKYFLQSPNQWEDLDRGLISNSISESRL